MSISWGKEFAKGRAVIALIIALFVMKGLKKNDESRKMYKGKFD